MVRRMEPGDAPAVADIFAEHDLTDLPLTIGVKQRTLFRFQDLYLHLVQSDQEFLSRLRAAHEHPLFVDIDRRLAPFLKPYGSGLGTLLTSCAERFYSWSAGDSGSP